MKISFGNKNDDGSISLTGSLTQEEADFISGVGIATILQAGVFALMEQQESLLEDMETEGPVQ